jgi:peptidoglycan/LPS O-acetylase OafA/YrhL
MIRIFPAYYFVLCCLLLFTDLQYPLSYVFYYLNLKIFALSLHPTPGFSALWANWDELATHNLHLWSLGVEEQFYLLYPLLFYGLSRRVMGRVFVATIAVGVATRAWLMHTAPGSFYGFLLPSTIEYFAWGSLFAYLDLQHRLPSERSSWWAIYVPTAAMAAAVAIEYGLGLDGYYMMQTTHFTSIVAPLTGLLIWGLWTERPEHPLVRLLNLRPLVYLGTISYPMYLVHLSMWEVYRRYFATIVNTRVAEPAWQTAWFYAITLALTIATGSAIWHFVEVPASRLKRFFPLSTITPLPVANSAAQTA